MSHFCTKHLQPTAKRSSILLAIGLLNIGLLFASVSVSASQFGGLSIDQAEVARVLATEQPWTQTRNLTTKTPHQLGIQTLSVERDEGKKSDPKRRARVYQFNYNSQRSRLVTVDVETGSIERVNNIESVHLPLNNIEIEHARALVELEPSIMSQISEIQQSRGLIALNDLSAIDVKASIFEPNDKAHECALQRCALISLFDQTRTVFTVEPVVNLQQQTVSTLSSATAGSTTSSSGQ